MWLSLYKPTFQFPVAGLQPTVLIPWDERIKELHFEMLADKLVKTNFSMQISGMFSSSNRLYSTSPAGWNSGACFSPTSNQVNYYLKLAIYI